MDLDPDSTECFAYKNVGKRGFGRIFDIQISNFLKFELSKYEN